MLCSIFALRECAGTFEHDIHLQLAVGECCGVFTGSHADRAVLRGEETVFITRISTIKMTVRGIKFEEMRKRMTIGQIVDQNDVNIRIARKNNSKRLSSDAAETVHCEIHEDTVTQLLKLWVPLQPNTVPALLFPHPHHHSSTSSQQQKRTVIEEPSAPPLATPRNAVYDSVWDGKRGVVTAIRNPNLSPAFP